MAYVNEKGYVARQTRPGIKQESKGRDWFLVKAVGNRKYAVNILQVAFPEDLAGEKVRFRIELVDDPEECEING